MSRQLDRLSKGGAALDSESSSEAEEEEMPKRLAADALTEASGALKHAQEEFSRSMIALTETLEGQLADLAVTASDVPSADPKEPAGRRPRRAPILAPAWEFRPRESRMSEMLTLNEDFQTVYRIAAAAMLMMFANWVLTSFLEVGSPLDLSMLYWAISASDTVVVLWGFCFVVGAMAVPLVQAVAHWKPRAALWLPVHFAMVGLIVVVPTATLLRAAAAGAPVPTPAAMVVMCECVRIAMKAHAYVREKVLWGTGPSAFSEFVAPEDAERGFTAEAYDRPAVTIEDGQVEVGRWLYFFFAPTLLYRDSYPRMVGPVRWLRALSHFLNVVLVILFTYLLWETVIAPEFEATATRPGDVRALVKSLFRSMLPGCFLLFLMHFMLLHSWLNAWAELLQFADRAHFYGSWWRVRGWGAYYRQWNTVVWAWLRTYVLEDSIRMSLGRVGRAGARLLVFAVSAAVHELIITCSLGYFFPVLLVMFGGPGVLFVSCTHRGKAALNNVLMWAALFTGTGLLLVLYAREHYARFVRPGEDSPLARYLQTHVEYLAFPGVLVPRSVLVFLATAKGM